jgi:nicotinate phosphoribosyltransferase
LSGTAFLTDHYELTMLDAALWAGRAEQRVVFEVFTRGLPAGRRFGVFAGLGRLLDALDEFVFGDDELAWLESRGVVSGRGLSWLKDYRFGGDVHAYQEGDLYTEGSPVLIVEASFGEAVLLETLVLSILNHDSAVAAAASLITDAARERPVIEMGSRRTDECAAVAAARAAYLGGFASTSNLEAGRRYGVPTAGTAAHAFVLLFPDEEGAFRAQVGAFGPDTTLLVDTYDTEPAIRRAIDVAGPSLGAIRIDSGDLAAQAAQARSILDSLGATGTKVVLTGDLDAESIRALRNAPVDVYGAGTSVVTGQGSPTAGFIYKLAAVNGHPVAKTSPGKRTFGGRKWAWRVAERAEEVVATDPSLGPEGGRPLQTCVVRAGSRTGGPTLEESRAFHRRVRDELGPGRSLTLVRPA